MCNVSTPRKIYLSLSPCMQRRSWLQRQALIVPYLWLLHQRGSSCIKEVYTQCFSITSFMSCYIILKIRWKYRQNGVMQCQYNLIQSKEISILTQGLIFPWFKNRNEGYMDIYGSTRLYKLTVFNLNMAFRPPWAQEIYFPQHPQKSLQENKAACGVDEWQHIQCTPHVLNSDKLILLLCWSSSCSPNPSSPLHFQTDKLIFGCVDANFCPPVTSTYQ